MRYWSNHPSFINTLLLVPAIVPAGICLPDACRRSASLPAKAAALSMVGSGTGREDYR
jgi:hypothetical protein